MIAVQRLRQAAGHRVRAKGYLKWDRKRQSHGRCSTPAMPCIANRHSTDIRRPTIDINTHPAQTDIHTNVRHIIDTRLVLRSLLEPIG